MEGSRQARKQNAATTVASHRAELLRAAFRRRRTAQTDRLQQQGPVARFEPRGRRPPSCELPASTRQYFPRPYRLLFALPKSSPNQRGGKDDRG
jgi:hypothetical protein